MSAEIELSVSEIQDLYVTDFHAWTQEQARLLKQRAWEQLDVANLVEEIESLGKQQRQELVNRLGVLLGHLLKWEFLAEYRCKSWYATIREHRRRIHRLLEQNPSLKPYLLQALTEAYPDGIDLVVRETPLRYRDLPAVCPYNLEQVLEGGFFPGRATEASDWE
jgi:hypothetical protein